jgi:Reductase C-terminal
VRLSRPIPLCSSVSSALQDGIARVSKDLIAREGRPPIQSPRNPRHLPQLRAGVGDAPCEEPIGDCASFDEPTSGRHLRLESVQNANDQARTALATLLGREEPYLALPWFCSEHGGLRLQMAGLMPDDLIRHRRAGVTQASFSILHYAQDRQVCVESVNAPMDHMAARKLQESGKSPSPEIVRDANTALKTLL